jgi:hypothetical protein
MISCPRSLDAPRDQTLGGPGGHVSDGLDEQRSCEMGFQQVLGRREARGVFPSIDEAGNAESHANGRLFGANSRWARGAAAVQRACDAQHASQYADEVLARLAQSSKPAVRPGGLGAAVVADHQGEYLPVVRLPAGRHRHRAEDIACGFLPRHVSTRTADIIKQRRRAQYGARLIVANACLTAAGHERVEESQNWPELPEGSRCPVD